MSKYMCDFETTTNPQDCRVWCSAMNEIGTSIVTIHNNIDDFMADLKAGMTLYFHNLKFDGDFIVNWLFRHGYKFVYRSSNARYERLAEDEFTAVISDMNVWYSIEIGVKGGRIKIYDSLKIIPFKVETIAKNFHLPIAKGKIDYRKNRPVGYQPTPQEIEYIQKDVLIVSQVLDLLFSQGLTKSTQGGNALYDFKQMHGGAKRFLNDVSYA